MRAMDYVGAALLAGILAAGVACSDDEQASETSGQDQGLAKQDGKTIKKDGPPPKGDSSKPVDKGLPTPGLTGWKDLPGKAPAAGAQAAVRLQDGRVLIVGGLIYDQGTKALASAWLYNPNNKVFAQVADMTSKRGSPMAVLLKDGRVLVMGGRESSSYSSLATAEIFNPATRKWMKVPDMPAKRNGAKAVRLPNGNVLVSGGYGANLYLDGMVIFDVKSASWITPALSMAVKRTAHTMTMLPNGKVVIAGGYGGTGTNVVQYRQLDSLEIYDSVSGTITLSKVKLANKRGGHTATLLDNGKVMLVGGYCGVACTPSGDALYDPVKDLATKMNHDGTTPSHHAVAKLNDGRVVVVGGSSSSETKVSIFQPKGLFWKSGPKLKHGRFDHSVILLKSGRLLVVGGKTGSPSNLKSPVVDIAEISVP